MNLVEQIGSGINRIMHLCKDYGVNKPNISVDDNWVTIIFTRDQTATQSEKNDVTEQVTAEIKKLVRVCTSEMSRNQLQDRLSLKHRVNFTDKYLNPALDAGLIEMTIPDKPRSSKQKYRLTAKGKLMRGKL